MRLIIDVLGEQEELKYCYTRSAVLMDPHMISLDFLVRLKIPQEKSISEE